MIYLQYFQSPYGELVLGESGGELCLCDWKYRKMRDQVDSRIQVGLQSEFKLEETDLLNEAKSQLNEYFARGRTAFDLPLLLVGSDFQKSVWEKLLTIPYGKTTSYLELSRILGDEKAIRAVATANGANAISIIVPCHRVIGSDGSLTGYAGGLNAKQKLLQLEGMNFGEQLELF
ncbi:methylated-DNA--[protein]-cysteine S-methyltransferase [Fluviicola chungangensis]|uniref:Methylated-DNA--protein-cysteine methyltransferase n=1 Tax=Fluviicola chungangensis TaxID=2597671 RepID=A0A556MQ05_9FLAO|nr:methylated-DNA--[protein]-cysteine S-methyltransferase [Fluviicola chungangensis]TSJ42034.1 methylated-DNA--[protein]-cysteine S-methyltransferase [Fluviicola chungangensis]